MRIFENFLTHTIPNLDNYLYIYLDIHPRALSRTALSRCSRITILLLWYENDNVIRNVGPSSCVPRTSDARPGNEYRENMGPPRVLPASSSPPPFILLAAAIALRRRAPRRRRWRRRQQQKKNNRVRRILCNGLDGPDVGREQQDRRPRQSG